MLFHIFAIALISSFIAIVVLGHVLLLVAIWPKLFGKREAQPKDTAGHVGSALRSNP